MADQPDYAGSCMIALYPPADTAEALAVPGGLDPDGMHLTVAYTGNAADVDPEALDAAALALSGRPPVTAAISGHARFTAGEQDCIVALADSPQLDELRRDAETALGTRGITIPSEHGFTAHLALQYLPAADPDPVGRIEAFPVTFAGVSAVHGKHRTTYTFTGEPSLPEQAAEAYLTGWASTGAPVTDATAPGCRAAVLAAVEYAASPDVLEVTLHLGKLAGAWATVYQRRADLIAAHADRIQAIWQKACKHLDVGRTVRTFRQQAALTSEASTPDGYWKAALKAEAAAAAAGMLHGITTGPEYDDLVAAIELALGAAQAEGAAGALGVAAEEAGEDGFDWDLAYDHMYAPVRDAMSELPGMGDEWVQDLIAGNAADIGQALAQLASSGGTYQQMADAVAALTTGGDLRAIQVLIDYAMTGSANQGALNLYASEGTETYDVMTAGDERVCPACLQAEEDNPHNLAPGTTPVVPEHPLCRCAVAPGIPLARSTYAPFLKAAA